VRLQGRGVRPFKISVPEFIITKGEITDSKLMRHMTKLGRFAVRRQVVEQAAEAIPAGPPGELASHPEASSSSLSHRFVIDVQTYPQSGIAERYKRMGLSVRQGQKLKTLLRAEGWINEELQLTSRGKVRVIRLTEQGALKFAEVDSGRSSRVTD